MKKIVFSFILLFGAVLFVPQTSFAQVVIKSQHNKNIIKYQKIIEKIIILGSNKSKILS